MATANHYKSNLRDIQFNLFEFLKVDSTTLGKKPFESLDKETALEAMATFDAFCKTDFASSYVDSDRIPLTLDSEGNVKLPASVKESIQKFFAADWHLYALPEALGGMGAPKSLGWAHVELFCAANAPAAIYACFTISAVQVIDKCGTPEQKKRFINSILTHHWGGTMVLTEPDAGSDVGMGVAKARHVEGDIWEIEGVKRFITNGDFDACENIVHLVLARPEGGPPGTKGLSFFLVPKFWVHADGSMGERNGVYVTNLEKKMGIKGSSTCELRFGEKKPARGVLLGNVHQGIRQMFVVMENARMATGIKSLAHLSLAYLNALEYAKDRVQGPDLLKSLDKTAPRVTIIKHPDVRRMLMMQKAHAEGMRALCLYYAHLLDVAEVTSSENVEKRADLLLPLVKAFNSERAYEVLALSLQVFGGSGYLQDYPIEQIIRDQKIDSLYEGTTHIQSLDLVFRKIAKDGGQTLVALFGDVRDCCSAAKVEKLAPCYRALDESLGHMETIFGNMMGKISESLYFGGLHGNRILFALSELIIGWLLVQHAEIAAQALPNAKDADVAFYEGKIASAQFWCLHVMPNILATKKVIEQTDLDIMEMSESAF